MNRDYGDGHYASSSVEDRKQGFASMELHRSCRGKHDRIARVVYWDACGQFSVETFGAEVPLDILEDLIAETKEWIKTK
jgi:hypothetical protein